MQKYCAIPTPFQITEPNELTQACTLAQGKIANVGTDRAFAFRVAQGAGMLRKQRSFLTSSRNKIRNFWILYVLFCIFFLFSPYLAIFGCYTDIYIYIYKLILERGRERLDCFSICPCIHWLTTVCVLTRIEPATLAPQNDDPTH